MNQHRTVPATYRTELQPFVTAAFAELCENAPLFFFVFKFQRGFLWRKESLGYRLANNLLFIAWP